MKFSVIIPVFNRPNEVDELLASLESQIFSNFEIIIVEDGSTLDSKEIVAKYKKSLDIKYFYKDNTGPGDSRNFGMKNSSGDYLVFFDSDCIIPLDYFSKVNEFLKGNYLDAYGGPDSATDSFSNIQKAINYSMTSFLTTGGIRGRGEKLDVFQPRSFNMGMSRKVYEEVGGFCNLHPGEDPDLSYRIIHHGFSVGLIHKAYVYHKRRIDLKKFAKQVYNFGVVRVILGKWHKGSLKMVYFMPSLFFLFSLASVILAIFITPFFLIPIIIFAVFIFFDALLQTRNLKIALLSIITSLVQLSGYGYGFLKSYWLLTVLKKDERVVFKNNFFDDQQSDFCEHLALKN